MECRVGPALLLLVTHPLLEGEVWRGAAGVLAGQQAVGVAGAGRVGVGGGVRARRAHGRRHVAVVVQQGAVSRVRGRRLGGGGVGPAQQRGGPPVHRLVRPEGRAHTHTAAVGLHWCWGGQTV